MLIELLEPRIAPAAVLNFTDVDGDHITIQISGGDITAITHPSGQGVQIDAIDANQAANGADLIVSAVKAEHGDGHVNIGTIAAADVSLGRIAIPGDLSGLLVGGPFFGPVLQSLQVASLNRHIGDGGDGNITFF